MSVIDEAMKYLVNYKREQHIAWNSGFRAFTHGKNKNSCKSKKSEYIVAWKKGWSEAKKISLTKRVHDAGDSVA